jgi:hypothetical protein
MEHQQDASSIPTCQPRAPGAFPPYSGVPVGPGNDGVACLGTNAPNIQSGQSKDSTLDAKIGAVRPAQ